MTVEKRKEPFGRPKIWTDERLKEEALLMVEWACKPDSLVLAEFYGNRGYDYDDVSHFEKMSDDFSKAKRISKIIIGARREKGALNGKLDSGVVRKSMALYDPEMKAYELELRNSGKMELTESLERSFFNALEEIRSQRGGASDSSSRPSLANGQPLLDKGSSRKENQVQDELGPKGDMGQSSHL